MTISAEKGYSRETGNLVFHVALLCSLVLIGIGKLYSYEGQRIVIQGADQGFCNTVSQYDNWKPGRFAAQGKVSPAPFCIDEMNSFIATYTADGHPTQFAANITYRPTVDSAPQTHTITVNHPLRLEGDRVYLIGHGFAPKITVTMPDGSVREDVEPFVPTDAATLLSEGAFKEQGKPGAKQDVGISGFFAPTPIDTGNGIISSISPQVTNPVLGIQLYTGDLNYNGLPQSVYSLDTTQLKKQGMANLKVGESTTAGGVTVRFDGWVPWVSLQVSHDPAQRWLLLSALAMVAGLLGSLSVRRRRIWVRVTREDGGSPTVVQVGGLARSDSGNFAGEFEGLVERLKGAVKIVSGVNGSMAHLSDTLFTTAIAIYSVAAIGFVAEYAFGRRGRIAATAPVKELAAVGGGATTSSQIGESLLPIGGQPLADLGPTPPDRRSSRAEKIGFIALLITVVGVFAHAASIVVRATAVDAVPWSNMYEFASVAGLVGVIAFVAVLWKLPALRHLGGFILLPVIVLMFLAGTVFYSPSSKLVPALQSYWLAIHVTLVAIAEGALMTSAVLTMLYLFKQRHTRAELAGAKPGRFAVYAAKLPAADALDMAAYRIVAFSFPLYTVAVICGAIWAEAAWGRYWGWDPKETWAFIVWVIYACYLHARATAGWKGRAAAWVNLAGFGAIIFNFVIVNVVISGLHSYAGLN